MNRILGALVAATVCAVPSAHAQGLGPAHPWQDRPSLLPPMLAIRDQDTRRDDPTAWIDPHMTAHAIGHLPHALTHSGGTMADVPKGVRVPNVVLPEAALRPSGFRPPTRFAPALGEGGTAIGRNVAQWAKAIIVGVAAAIAAAFRAVFGGIFGGNEEP